MIPNSSRSQTTTPSGRIKPQGDIFPGLLGPELASSCLTGLEPQDP
jgi:hypothetical protein